MLPSKGAAIFSTLWYSEIDRLSQPSSSCDTDSWSTFCPGSTLKRFSPFLLSIIQMS